MGEANQSFHVYELFDKQIKAHDESAAPAISSEYATVEGVQGADERRAQALKLCQNLMAGDISSVVAVDPDKAFWLSSTNQPQRIARVVKTMSTFGSPLKSSGTTSMSRISCVWIA